MTDDQGYYTSHTGKLGLPFRPLCVKKMITTEYSVLDSFKMSYRIPRLSKKKSNLCSSQLLFINFYTAHLANQLLSTLQQK